jgi:hypothetical protein
MADHHKWVKGLAVVCEALLDLMCVELPMYFAEAKGVVVNRADVDDFTEAVLQLWRNSVLLLPACARAERIVFEISCNSSSCE